MHIAQTMKKARGAPAAAVPDAWEDDDWETLADKAAAQGDEETLREGGDDNAAGGVSLTKTERLAKHAEANRKLWESAEAPAQTFHYLEANSTVPLTSSFKPQVKVLSRKPVIARRDPATGMAQLSVNDGDDDGDEDKKEVQLTPEEIRAKQKRDREEKQRRYDEARAKIFGESAPSSRGSSPGTTTPPRQDGARYPGQGRGRGRGGGGGGAGRGSGAGIESRQAQDMRRTTPQNGPVTRELYDPNHAAKPDQGPLRRGSAADGEPSTRSPPPKDDAFQPIRAPRGPDGSGRGFGFARRGARGS
ncbi:SUZ domain-containing protein [Purpureocillium lavendulum]|uniref:SUZ domain-containing protein n=1 Tax=Purpureocillium lavendulum TaxID=1247861 RepID=A0AB34G369_9HYPO|nr:SUZ domain-containing protein [Purpureocillium lavendulum]